MSAVQYISSISAEFDLDWILKIKPELHVGCVAKSAISSLFVRINQKKESFLWLFVVMSELAFLGKFEILNT